MLMPPLIFLGSVVTVRLPTWPSSVDFVTGPFRAAVDMHKRTCEWLYAAKNH